MGKGILVLIYVLLVISSGYNLYSFKPDIGFGVKLEKGTSQSLQSYITIRNISENNFTSLDVLVDNKHYLHIYSIESKNIYNSFPTQFLELDIRPRYSSRVLIEREEREDDRLDKGNKIFNDKVDFLIFKEGEYYNQKL